MKVHNLMEDVVSKLVDKLYDQAKKDKAPWLTCDCENCRIDSISYVLNRITPKYIVSDRGVTHSLEILNDKQLLADIVIYYIQETPTYEKITDPTLISQLETLRKAKWFKGVNHWWTETDNLEPNLKGTYRQAINE